MLPAQPVPEGFVSADNVNGGRLVYGKLDAQPSEEAAFRGALRRADAYFGHTLQLVDAVRFTESEVPSIAGVFHANLLGTSVAGLVITAIDPAGGPRVAMLFDRDDRIRQSLGGLVSGLQSVGAKNPPDNGGTAEMPTVTAQDGTMSIAVPAGWTVRTMSDGGIYDIAGPDGERIFHLPSFVTQPGAFRVTGWPVVPYTRDVAKAFAEVSEATTPSRPNVESVEPLPDGPFTIGARLTGTWLVNGVLRRFEGNVYVCPPNPNGGWTLEPWLFSAPADRFAQARPVLLAIERSFRRNAEVADEKSRQTSREIQANTLRMLEANRVWRAGQAAVFEQSMAGARAAQDSIDRSTAGVVNYLNDWVVVGSADPAMHGTFSAGLARALVAADPHRFSIVPMSQYQKGVDY